MVQLIEEQGREELSTAQRSAWMARLCSVDHAYDVPPYLRGSGFELLEFHKGSLIDLSRFKCNRSASAQMVVKENVIHQLPTERKPGFCYFRGMEFFTVDMLIAFGSLCFLEIVLGIDNIIFISLLTNQLEEGRRPMARTAGIALALVLRVGMLFGISYIIGLTQPLLEISSWQLTGRDLILFAGGVFLIWKSTSEIHHKVTGNGHEEEEQELWRGPGAQRAGLVREDATAILAIGTSGPRVRRIISAASSACTSIDSRTQRSTLNKTGVKTAVGSSMVTVFFLKLQLEFITGTCTVPVGITD